MLGDHLLIERTGAHELFVGSGPGHTAFPHHHDLICPSNGVQVVGYAHDGLVAGQVVYRLLYEGLVLGIDCGRRLVEDDDGGVFQHHPGDRDSLALAARELDAALAGDRRVAVREPGDEVVDTRPLGRLDDLFMRCARPADEDVLLDALVEKEHVLLDYGEEARHLPFGEAGLPKDAFINIYASGSQMDAFVADKRIKGVSLTGSEAAGAAVAKTAGENYKKSVLELGGNDPFIIIDDKKLEWTLDQFVPIRMYNTGQACNAPKRLVNGPKPCRLKSG